MYNDTNTAMTQANDHHNRQTEPAAPQPLPGKNPRLVIGGLDYFDMLMEQEEQT